jgi:hypothetical protein
MNTVIDPDRIMNDYTNRISTGNERAKTRKLARHLDMTQDGVAKTFRRVRKVDPGILENGFEVRYCRLRDSNLGIHSGIICRTSSRGTVRPSSASLIPRSMAASVSWSSPSRRRAGLSKSIFLSTQSRPAAPVKLRCVKWSLALLSPTLHSALHASAAGRERIARHFRPPDSAAG